MSHTCARPITTISLVCAVAALCNCSEQEHGPAPSVVAAVTHKAVAANGNEAGAQNTTAQAPVYVYSSMGHRDPFRSYLADLHERQQAENKDHKREETENFALSQYRLTAVISSATRPTAMVEDPTGKGHLLRIGNYIGKNSGKVTNIDATGMSIVEETLDGTGKTVLIPTVLRLPNNDEASVHTP